LISIPGNHDWMGGIEHYEEMFVSGRTFAGHWTTVQRNNWFHVALPQGWWLWGIDTGLHDTLVGPQEDYFRKAAESLRPGDRVILVTPVPLWQLRQKFPEEYATMRTTFDPMITGAGATMPLTVSADSHLFAHMERVDIDEVEDHITAGGGGAFLQPTHNLPVRVPREGGTAELKLTSRWPLPADSRSIAAGAKHAFSSQFVPLMVIFGLLFAGYAALVNVRFLARAVRIPDPDCVEECSDKFVDATSVAQLGWTKALEWSVVSPLATAMLVLVACFGLVAFRGNSLEPKLASAARVYGLVGGASISATFLVVNTTRLDVVVRPSAWVNVVAWILASALAGVVGLAAFLAVIRWANRRVGVNDSLAYLPAESTRFKHFLRFRIDSEGDLTCYAVGIDPVGEGWYDAMTPSDGAPTSVPPYDPDGAPHLQYVWGKTYQKFEPTPVRAALSISDTERTRQDSLVDAFDQLGAALIDGGHSIMFGGMPGKGYTDRLHRLDRERHSDNPNAEPHLFNYVAEHYWSDAEAEAVRDRMHSIRVGRPADDAEAEAEAEAEADVERVIGDLTAMRRLMSAHADVRVVIGGALQPGQPGTRRAPGIVEEAFLAVEAGRPLIVAGGFGGASGLIADALLGRLDPRTVDDLARHFVAPASPSAGVSFEEMLTRFRSPGVLRNGLTDGENVELLKSRHAPTVAALVMRSVRRLGTPRTS
jgi:hypothetical protein